MLVNLDKGIRDIILEARWLRQLGLQVPQTAQAVLLQEDKFTLYHRQLSHALEVLLFGADTAALAQSLLSF